MTTWAGDAGIDDVTIDRMLNHVRRSVTGRHYDHSKREPALRAAWQAWADHVWQVVGLAPTGATASVPNLAEERRKREAAS